MSVNALMLPQFDYMDIIWCRGGKTKLNSLDILYKKVAKIALDVHWQEPSVNVYRNMIVRGKVAIRWIFLFTRISQRNMVVRTPTNIIRLVANFVSHGKTTFYHILPPSYHLSGLPNIFRCERRKGHKLIEDVYLIEEKNFFWKKFYVGESGNWIITN